MAREHNEHSGFPVKKALIAVMRASLIIAPLAWIYARTDTDAVMAILGSVSVPLLFLIAVLTFSAIALQGVKWWILIRRFVHGLRAGRAVAAHVESVFYAIALPTALAQDVVRSMILSKSHDPSVVWASAWLGRLIGLVSLLAYSAVGLIYLRDDALPAGLREALIAAIAIVALLGALSFSKRLTRPILAAAYKILPKKFTARFEKLRNGIYEFRYAHKTLLLAFIVSAAIQLIAICAVSLTVFAVSGKFYFLECLTFVPLVEIAAMALPLTPGGMGVRETLLALLFSRMDFSEGQVASYVTLGLLMSMVRAAGGLSVIYRMIFKK